MAQYLNLSGLQTLWNRIKEYAKITTTSGTTKVIIGSNEVIIPSGISPSDATPQADGTAAAGSSNLFSRGDHVHPTDTTRAAVSATVSTITYGSNKITKTINGTTTDVVTASAIVTDGGALLSTAKGAANGVCPLDANQKVPAANLPSYVDDVVEAYPRTGQTALSSTWLATESASGTVITPESGVIYVLMTATTDYSQYSEFRFGGTTYVKINDGGMTALSEQEIIDNTPLS